MKKQTFSQGARKRYSVIKSRIEKIDSLIANLDILIALSNGTRKFTYKIRRSQASKIRKQLKRLLHDKPYKSERTNYVANTKAVQGGAPGLKSQKK